MSDFSNLLRFMYDALKRITERTVPVVRFLFALAAAAAAVLAVIIRLLIDTDGSGYDESDFEWLDEDDLQEPEDDDLPSTER
jgi:hypothetical protein